MMLIFSNPYNGLAIRNQADIGELLALTGYRMIVKSLSSTRLNTSNSRRSGIGGGLESWV